MGNALAAGSRLAPKLPETLIPSLRNRNDGLAADIADTQISIPAHDSIPQIANRLRPGYVHSRDARSAQAIRDYNVRRPAARTQAERRSHQEGGH